MIAQSTPKVNSCGWPLPPSPPTVNRRTSPGDDEPRRSPLQWYGVFDRPIPRQWRVDEVALAEWWPTYDDTTRYAFLEAAHWLIDAPLDELRRVIAVPHPAYHAGHVMAASVMALTRAYPPIDITPAVWLMRVRQWRDDHLGMIGQTPPPWPWIDDPSPVGYAHCVAATYAVAMAVDRVAMIREVSL